MKYMLMMTARGRPGRSTAAGRREGRRPRGRDCALSENSSADASAPERDNLTTPGRPPGCNYKKTKAPKGRSVQLLATMNAAGDDRRTVGDD